MLIERLWPAIRERLRETQLPPGVAIKEEDGDGLSGFQPPDHMKLFLAHRWAPSGRIPILYITAAAHTKMWFYTMRCPVEIRWLLSCYELQCGNLTILLVNDALLPVQRASPGGVIVKASDDGRLRSALYSQASTEHIPDTLWGAGHSHHSMPVYNSSTDVHEFSVAMGQEERFVIRVIANKYSELLVCVGNVQTGQVYEDVEWFAEPLDITDELRRELEQEYRAKVTVVATDRELFVYQLSLPPIEVYVWPTKDE